LLDKFKEMALVSIESGASCLFWDDLWFGQVPKHVFPELYSFTKNPNMSLQTAKLSLSLIQTFHLPLSIEAHHQFIQLEQAVNNFNPQILMTVGPIFGEGRNSIVSQHKQLSGSAGVHPVFRWIWKSSCQHKHKVFFWLLAQDRLSTRNILRRKNMH